MGQRGRPILRGINAGAQLQSCNGATKPGGPAKVHLVQAGKAAKQLAVVVVVVVGVTTSVVG